MKKINLVLSFILIAMIITSCSGSESNVTIGKQVWMAENLNVEKFRNGDPIPHAQTAKQWEWAGENEQPAWCFYENMAKNGEKYGKLYNLYALNDPRGLAPEGWKIPFDENWKSLIDYLGGEIVAGKKMKPSEYWFHNDGKINNVANESGFSALPGGYRTGAGDFEFAGEEAVWWSSSKGNQNKMFYLSAVSDLGSMSVDLMGVFSGPVSEQDNRVVGTWAVLEKLYHSRSNVSLNLVNIIRDHKDYKQETLIKEVIEATVKAKSMKISPTNLSLDNILTFGQSQKILSDALSNLLVSVEEYPDLKASREFQQLLIQLESVENRIFLERRPIYSHINKSKNGMSAGLSVRVIKN